MYQFITLAETMRFDKCRQVTVEKTLTWNPCRFHVFGHKPTENTVQTIIKVHIYSEVVHDLATKLGVLENSHF